MCFFVSINRTSRRREVLPFCSRCGRYTGSQDRFCSYCGAVLAAATQTYQQPPSSQYPVVYPHEHKGSSAGAIIVVLIIVVLLVVVGLPMLANISQHAGQNPIPGISQVTYTAHIRTATTEHVRYNVVSWNVEKGDVPMTYTVALYYVGGGSETFHWVVSYNFERE